MFRQIVAIPIGTNCAPLMAYTVINFNFNSIELNQIKTLFFLRVLVIAMCKYTAWDTKNMA